ncbi:MAG: hypothetical protein V1659_00420 [Candidatus Woesearchaeota archaeon]
MANIMANNILIITVIIMAIIYLPAHMLVIACECRPVCQPLAG